MFCYRFEYRFLKIKTLSFIVILRVLQCVEMPYSGTEEWRARIGQWENRKLHQTRCTRFCLRALPPAHQGWAYSKISLLYVLLLLSLAGKMVTDMFALGLPARRRPTGLGRYCTYIQNLATTPIFFLLLALSLLLIIAGDVEINPGPFNGENEKRTEQKILYTW